MQKAKCAKFSMRHNQKHNRIRLTGASVQHSNSVIKKSPNLNLNKKCFAQLNLIAKYSSIDFQFVEFNSTKRLIAHKIHQVKLLLFFTRGSMFRSIKVERIECKISIHSNCDSTNDTQY